MKKSSAFTDRDIVIREQAAPEIPEETTTVDGYVFETKAVPKRAGRTGTLTYPIDKLEAGSDASFLVPTTPDKAKSVLQSVRSFGYRHKFNVTLRIEDSGVRVWRAA